MTDTWSASQFECWFDQRLAHKSARLWRSGLLLDFCGCAGERWRCFEQWGLLSVTVRHASALGDRQIAQNSDSNISTILDLSFEHFSLVAARVRAFGISTIPFQIEYEKTATMNAVIARRNGDAGP